MAEVGFEAVGVMFCVVISLTITLCTVRLWKREARCPPGPRGVPYVGTLFWIRKELHVAAFELNQTMLNVGILFYKMGHLRYIICNSSMVFKDIQDRGQKYLRPARTMLDLLVGEKDHDSTESTTTECRSSSDDQIEKLACEQVAGLTEALNAENSCGLDPQYLVQKCAGNLLGSVTFDTDLQNDDFSKFVQTAFKVIAQTNTSKHRKFLALPCTFKLRRKSSALTKLKNDIERMQQIAEKLDTENSRRVCEEFLCGLEVLNGFILWALLFAATDFDVQERLQAEITKTIGRREACVHDMEKMPFTQAFLAEVHRFRPVHPLPVLGCTLSDSKMGEFEVPRSSVLLLNVHAVHREPAEGWKTPNDFDPAANFLIDDQKFFCSSSLMPFVGSAYCDKMMHKMIFLVLVGMLQRFDLLLAEDQKFSVKQIFRGVLEKTGGHCDLPLDFNLRFLTR